MAIGIAKVHASPTSPVVDLHVVDLAGAAAIDDSLALDAAEDFVEFRVINFERVVVMVEVFGVVEVER